MSPKKQDAENTRAGKLSVPLTADGTIDWDNVRPSTAQKMLELLKTDSVIKEELAEQAGTEGDSELKELLGGEITQENCGAFLDIATGVQVGAINFATKRFIKHPFLRDAQNRPVPLKIEPDILAALKLTKEQHAELDPRLLRLAKKNTDKLPPWVKENLDIILFSLMFLKYGAANFKMALTTQVQRDIEKIRTARAASQPKQPQPTSDAPPTPQPQAAPTNGVDHNPPPSFSGMTDDPVPPPPEAPTV